MLSWEKPRSTELIVILSSPPSTNAWYLTDFPPNQNIAQGHFIVGNHAQIKTHVQLVQKIFHPIQVPQSINQLNPEQVKPVGTALRPRIQ